MMAYPWRRQSVFSSATPSSLILLRAATWREHGEITKPTVDPRHLRRRARLESVESLDALLRLVERLREPHPLDRLMQLIADATAEVIGTRRASVRLLDPNRTSLIAVARAGEPLHDRPVEFRTGEGLLGWIVQHGQVVRIDDAERDPRFTARAGMTERMGAFLGAPIRVGTECTGVISVVDPDRMFDAQHEQLVVLIAALCGPYLEIARLARLSRVDPLTGALNRRGLDLAFPPDAADLVMPLAAVMIDIDRFKQVNDTYGHAMGDLVLRKVAAVCGEAVRVGDAVVRYGGEEFLLLLPTVDCVQAARIAERVRAAVAVGTTINDQWIAVTISAGVADRRPGEARDELLARADAALYRAKLAGRDRIEVAS